MLELSLLKKAEVFDNARVLNRKINIYKKAISQKAEFSPRVFGIFDAQVPGIIFTQVSIDQTFANLNFTSDTALKVALVITNLTKQSDVAEIILEGATLDSQSRTFDVDLKVIYK